MHKLSTNLGCIHAAGQYINLHRFVRCTFVHLTLHTCRYHIDHVLSPSQPPQIFTASCLQHIPSRKYWGYLVGAKSITEYNTPLTVAPEKPVPT